MLGSISESRRFVLRLSSCCPSFVLVAVCTTFPPEKRGDDWSFEGGRAGVVSRSFGSRLPSVWRREPVVERLKQSSVLRGSHSAVCSTSVPRSRLEDVSESSWFSICTKRLTRSLRRSSCSLP